MASPPTYPSLDLGFLKYWSPARCMFFGIVFYFVAVITSPLIYDYSYISSSGAVYAIAVFGAFFGGCYIAKTTNSPIEDLQPLPFRISLDRYINISIIIASIGILSRVYDRFILRGFAIQETFAETRETLGANVSMFGYIGGLAFSFGLIVLTLVWLGKTQDRRRIATIIAMLLAAYPMAEGLLGASRSPMLHTAILVFILARTTRALNWFVKSRIALLAATVAMLIFFQYLFELRTLETGGFEESISEVYRLTGMAEYAWPPAWITNAIVATEGHGLYADILKVWVHMEQHITHSWIVYFANIQNFDGEYGWGYMHLSLPIRVISFISGQEIFYDPALHGISEGMYGTSLSPIFYDFGGFGPPLACAFGYCQSMIHRGAIRLPERWLPLHLLMCLANFMALMENPLTSGLGAFAVWGILLYIGMHFIVTLLSHEPSLSPRKFPVQAGASLP
jgi:hypothetical protein